MSQEFTLKEIPLQILQVPENGILILRVSAESTTEYGYRIQEAMQMTLKRAGRDDVSVAVMADDIELAVVTK